MTIQILLDGDDSRYVNLSRALAWGDHLTELNARFVSSDGKTVAVQLFRMRDHGKAKSFELEADELDALIEAVTDYRAFLAQKREQEARETAKKLDRLKERVAALGGTLTVIPKSEKEDPLYKLKFEGRWANHSMSSVNLWRIEECVKWIEKDGKRLDESEGNF